MVATRKAERMLLGTGGTLHNTYETRTNSRGEYRIYGLPPGSYLVDARPGGVSARSATGCGGPRVSTPVAVQIPFLPQPHPTTAGIVMSTSGEMGCGSIEGRITGLASGDVALVTVFSSDFPSRRISSERADKSGQFRFSGIAVGEYTVIAVAPVSGASGTVGVMNSQTLVARQHVIVSPSVATELSLPLTPPRTVTLAFPSESGAGGECIRGHQIRLSSIEEWGGMHEFSIPLFPDGRRMSFTALPVTYEVRDTGLRAGCIVSAPSRLTVDSIRNLDSPFSVVEPAEIEVSSPGDKSVSIAANEDHILLLVPQEDSLMGIGLTTVRVSRSEPIEVQGLAPGRYSIQLLPRALWDDPERSIFDADNSLLTLQPGTNRLGVP